MSRGLTAAASGAILLRGGTLLYHGDQDHVEPLRDTDILVRNNRIAKIGKSIAAPVDAEFVDCRGKIITPGFVDTHHHLWQTQLKGCHADQSVFDYIPTGFWQSYVYTPKDMFWGQLGGALEAIASGTTFVLDHAHGNQSNDHGLDGHEKAKLAETQVPVSSTPDTEAQMGFGWPLAFTPGINYTLGVDCHTNNTSSILSLARTALQLARQRNTVKEMNGGEGAPQRMDLRPTGSTEDAFNAATIRGARAVLLGNEIGSIKEGKLADLVIFDALGSVGMSCVSESDPLTAVVRHSDSRDIEAVMIDGVWRKKDGKLCPVAVEETGASLAWPAIRQNLLASQRDIQERQKNLNVDKAKEALVAMFQIDKSKLVKS
ncbi:hypothetical protein K4K57_004146 [Colletotrichum sp. SAR 10_99]|nr:hypothetical protein K4K57_004146 [Colletotrichum sp. SAR 10_99]